MPHWLRQWAKSIKRDAHALYLAARDPRVPWPAKALAVCVAAYALGEVAYRDPGSATAGSR